MPAKRKKRAKASGGSGVCPKVGLLDVVDLDCMASVLSSPAMCCRVGAVALALTACSCRMLGLKGQRDGKGGESTSPSMAVKAAQDFAKEEFGVTRLPLFPHDEASCVPDDKGHWDWPRMLYWVSGAIRVGRQHAHKSISDGVNVAIKALDVQESLGKAFPHALVLVEPGVYEETVQLENELNGGDRLSIWGCDRETVDARVRTKEKQKVDWRGPAGPDTPSGAALELFFGESCVGSLIHVDGMSISSVTSCSVVCDGGRHVRVYRCDLSCE
jgi:hypothetical protein